MGFETLRQKTLEMFKTGYNTEILRKEFDRALEEFTAQDWRRAACSFFGVPGIGQDITYLFMASQLGWQDVVVELINSGAPVNHKIQCKDEPSVTAIHIAAIKNHLTIVKMLVETSINDGIWNKDSEEYIDVAYQCTPEIFEYFSTTLNVYGKARKAGAPDWFCFNISGRNRHDIFCYLYKKNYFQNDFFQEGGWDYLQLMLVVQKISGGCPEQILLERLPSLLDAGIDLNYEDQAKRTALFWAVNNKYFDLARCMIESDKVNITKRNLSNQCIYQMLIDDKNYEFLSYMLKKGLLSDVGHEERASISTIFLWDDFIRSGRDSQLISLIIDSAPIINESMKKNYKSIRIPIFGFTNHPIFLIEDHRDFFPCYYTLFNEKLIELQRPSKKFAIKYALAACFNIMDHPSVSTSLLGDFDKILETNWNNEFPENPMLTSLNFDCGLQEYVGLLWPVPTDTVSKNELFSKNGFLEKQCIAFMRERGFSKNVIKMYDVLFDGTFEKLISNVDMFTESTLNPHLLVHGKNIHNIARILLVIAWERGLIPNEYDENDTKYKITLQELFAAMVDADFSHPKSKAYAWTQIFDMRLLSKATFSDPYQMHSHLMVYCKDSLPTLSRLMTHSFCKATLRLRDFVNDLTGEKWTTKEVWDRYITVRIPQTVTSSTAQVLSWSRKTGKLPADSSVTVQNPVAHHRLEKY